jgi:stage II sporulation protein D
VTLLNLKRHPLKAYYHSDCGGKTVSASSVWKQETENDVGVASDEFCATNPRSQWKLTMAKQKLADLLKNFAGDLRSNEFRKLVGFMQLKSTKFEIFQKTDKKSDENNKDEIEFVGRGFGHGVGMCQWGSKDLGARGFSYQRILQHYYPLATFQFRR